MRCDARSGVAVAAMVAGLFASSLTGSSVRAAEARPAADEALAVGDQIRVTLKERDGEPWEEVRVSPWVSEARITGYFERIDADTLYINLTDPYRTLSVDLHDIKTLEVRRRLDHGPLGGFLGALGGATVGAIIGKATETDPECEPGELICGDLESRPLVGGVLGGIVGAALGYTIGSNTPKEVWRPVDIRHLSHPSQALGGLRW